MVRDFKGRSDVKYLGKIIGSSVGWDTCGDATDLIFYDFSPTAIGEKFLRGVKVPEQYDLCILLADGQVQLSHVEGEDFISIEPDWSVFNEEKV